MDHWNTGIRALLFAGAFMLAYTGFAQVGDPEFGCKIRYTYDNAGNRIQRDWYCWGHGANGGGDGRSEAQTAEQTEGSLSANSLTAVPNPAKDHLRVDLKIPIEDGLFEITDMKGQVIATTRATGQMAEFDVSQLSAASYFIRLTVGSERLMTTFTVERQ